MAEEDEGVERRRECVALVLVLAHEADPAEAPRLFAGGGEGGVPSRERRDERREQEDEEEQLSDEQQQRRQVIGRVAPNGGGADDSWVEERRLERLEIEGAEEGEERQDARLVPHMAVAAWPREQYGEGDARGREKQRDDEQPRRHLVQHLLQRAGVHAHGA